MQPQAHPRALALDQHAAIHKRIAEIKGKEFLDRLGPMFVGTIHSYCLRMPHLRCARRLQTRRLRQLRFLATQLRTPPIRYFIEKSCKAIILALLQQSAHDKKNEPAFYKALNTVKPAIKSAAYRARPKIRQYYKDLLSA